MIQMKEVLCLATGNSYDMVTGNNVTAHPAQRPYPRFEPEYLIPIKKGGVLEYLYNVEDIIECLPEDIYTYADKLAPEQYNNLVSYHRARSTSYGYAKKETKYRFYLLKKIAPIQQPCLRKGIQVSVRMDLADIKTVE